MPVYEYRCPEHLELVERIVPVGQRDVQPCEDCGQRMVRILGAPRFRFKGVATKGGGPDKFTADMLGIPLKELPSGLRTDKGAPK